MHAGMMICGVVLIGLTALESVDGPEKTVRALLDDVRLLSEASGSEAEGRTASKISEKIDISGVSKSCLSATWDKLPESERAKFVGLFREVLEKVAYPKSAKFFKDTEIALGDTTNAAGGKAKVSTEVTHREEGMVEVDYSLSSVNGKWLIQDVELDGVSLVLDLRSQMQKIIRENSYETLKSRLREKLEEETAAKAPASPELRGSGHSGPAN